MAHSGHSAEPLGSAAPSTSRKVLITSGPTASPALGALPAPTQRSRPVSTLLPAHQSSWSWGAWPGPLPHCQILPCSEALLWATASMKPPKTSPSSTQLSLAPGSFLTTPGSPHLRLHHCAPTQAPGTNLLPPHPGLLCKSTQVAVPERKPLGTLVRARAALGPGARPASWSHSRSSCFRTHERCREGQTQGSGCCCSGCEGSQRKIPGVTSAEQMGGQSLALARSEGYW